MQRAKQQGHDTGGMGNAYSHNFLNQSESATHLVFNYVWLLKVRLIVIIWDKHTDTVLT